MCHDQFTPIGSRGMRATLRGVAYAWVASVSSVVVVSGHTVVCRGARRGMHPIGSSSLVRRFRQCGRVTCSRGAHAAIIQQVRRTAGTHMRSAVAEHCCWGSRPKWRKDAIPQRTCSTYTLYSGHGSNGDAGCVVIVRRSRRWPRHFEVRCVHGTSTRLCRPRVDVLAMSQRAPAL